MQGLDDQVEITGTVKIEGQIENTSFQHCLEFDVVGNPSASESPAPIHRLAAKSQIKELEDKELIEDPSQNRVQSHKQDIILISTAANIMSKYTSFVGVDKESKIPMKLEKPKITKAFFGCRSSPGKLHSAHGMHCSASMGGGPVFGSAPNPNGMSAISGGNLFGSAQPNNMYFSPQASYGGFGSVLNANIGQVPMKSSFGLFGSKPNTVGQQESSSLTGFGLSAPAVSGFRFGSEPQLQRNSSFGGSTSQQGSGTTNVQTGMMGLIFLQTFVGSWELTNEFATVISIPLDVLRSYSNTQSSDVWATCLALAWLEKYYSTQKQEWMMIGQKANTWLKQQTLIGVDLNSVMTAAQTCINQNCSTV